MKPKTTSAKAMVCSYCNQAWPIGPDFAACPCCREGTLLSDTHKPMSTERAHAVRLDFAFGWWLWDTERILTESPPEPHEIPFLDTKPSQSS